MKILLLNQAFYPDVVSTAQHLTELAEALVEAGHQVTVLCSSRAYDDPQRRFAKSESWKGVEIIRLRCSAFGKKGRWRRAADFGTFLLSCAFRLLTMRRFDLVVGLTSPPLISVLGAAFAKVKGGKFVFWVMDLNPDEAVAAGWLREGAATERLLSWLLRFSLRASARVVALDAYMKQRLMAKGVAERAISVIPPWPHDEAVAFDGAGGARFRARHGLEGKYVVMYSGNHSPCHPLDTLLEAAREVADDERIVFCFVGGGSEFEKVRVFAAEHGLTNVVQLPYQPLTELASSLSAADLQVVVMGNPFVGIVHPCKIYNLLTVGTPVLYIGPEVSHIADILRGVPNQRLARSIRHGAVEEVAGQIRSGAAEAMRPRRGRGMNTDFSRERLLAKMIAALEAAAGWQTEKWGREEPAEVSGGLLSETGTDPAAVPKTRRVVASGG